MSKQKRPPAVDALGKLRSVAQMNDKNLCDLHDFALMALVQCQQEMERRGMESGVIVRSTGRDPPARGDIASPRFN